MITDQLRSATTEWLSRQSPVIYEAFAWIAAMPNSPDDGTTELHGRLMYAMVQSYATKAAGECRWESHRHTIDIQYVFEGGEAIDYLRPGQLEPIDDYAEARDVEHWRPVVPPAATLRLSPGTFVIFLAGEPHRPKVHDGANAAVRKLVIKIDSSLLLTSRASPARR